MLTSGGSNIRVLQFAPRACWPLDTGAKLRNYHLGRVLSEHAQIVLLSFMDDGQSLGNLESFYQKVVPVRRDPGYTAGKILRGALGRSPLPVLNYTTDAMKQTLARTLAEIEFDIVQVESIHLFAYLQIIHSARNRPLAVCDWHNIESELMWRYSEREPNFLRRTYARKTSVQLSALERAAMREFDAHVVVSPRDEERLQRLNPGAQSFVIENGVDTAHYSDDQIQQAHGIWAGKRGPGLHMRSQSPTEIRRRIVFVGSMDYHANVDAVVSFARDVWPLIHDSKPELTFTIVGRDPTAEVVALSSTPGIEVTGTVDDVRPYYYESVAAIIPLRVGGGTRLKILEAMAAGVAVVSTTLGAEGLDVQHNENILIADTNQELSEGLMRVVENDDLRGQLRSRGRDLVTRQYDWSTLGSRLFEIYQKLSTDFTPSSPPISHPQPVS